MEALYTVFYQQLNQTNMQFKRYLFDKINWNNRLISLLGARGSGKTTLLLQYVKEKYGHTSQKVLYASLDHIWFGGKSLYELGESFVQNGGELLILDEVHKYATWSREIKNLYDGFPELKIIFTGSSILEISKGEADLSRRAVQYFLPGMSFREFLKCEKALDVKPYTLKQILTNHIDIAQNISSQIKVLPAFSEYLRVGYYPYYLEGKDSYLTKLAQTINAVLEYDLPAIEKVDFSSIDKVKKLLYVISTMVPFSPNISKLSQDVGVSRNSLLAFIHFLKKAQAIQTLEQKSKSFSKLAKPEKIYLGNTNLCYAFAWDTKPDIGNLRETFFCNQTSVSETVEFSKKTDFLINQKYHFEIGGKNKGKEQIMGLPNAFLALDDLEIGYGNKIPLWLFGLLY